MRMFTKEELKKIKEQYYEIYQPFIETDYFSLLYDKSEKEWCYVIDENITEEQLNQANQKFIYILVAMFGTGAKTGSGIDIVQDKIKNFTISDYIDNCNNMMADKDLLRLYEKFNFMLPAFKQNKKINLKNNLINTYIFKEWFNWNKSKQIIQI